MTESPQPEPVRNGAVKAIEPDFIGKAELARHLCCHGNTIDNWIGDGTIPPPHYWPGPKHPLWLRKWYVAFRDTGKWPKEAWKWNRGRTP